LATGGVLNHKHIVQGGALNHAAAIATCGIACNHRSADRQMAAGSTKPAAILRGLVTNEGAVRDCHRRPGQALFEIDAAAIRGLFMLFSP
jgi:hypothetical protein